jgi:16S rRNA (guanine(527)-N(7))-methyltransferase RsmG
MSLVGKAGSHFANVPRETLGRLAAFVDLLRRWNARINLVGRAEDPKLWERHVADSLQLAPLIPALTRHAIDLGSGAGFPGLVLAIVTGIPFDLVEADHRKAAFLREAVRATRTDVRVHAARIEAVQLEPADLVTARALAPLPALLTLAYRFMPPDGVALFPKGAEADRELTEAGAAWNMRVERFPSRTDPAGTIFKLSEVQRG